MNWKSWYNKSMKTVVNTPKTIESDKEKILRLEAEVQRLNCLVKGYEEGARLQRAKKFGPSSEKAIPDQLHFFDEAEMEADSEAIEPTVEEITYTREKKKKKAPHSLSQQLDGLPTEEIHYDLPDEEKVCPKCDHSLHQMSESVRTEVVFVPAVLKVVKHVQKVYACRACEANHENSPIINASMPKPAFPKSLASPSLVAGIMNAKFVDAVPLHRQEKGWKAHGIKLSRQNMANWVIQGSNRWLEPIYERLHQHLVLSDYIHGDETTLQVQSEPDRAASQKSYMWLYASHEEAKEKICLFEYQTTRAGKHPRKFLKNFSGYLQSDGYTAYNDIPGVVQVGCLVHARRRFLDAIKAASKKVDRSTFAGTIGKQHFDGLFHARNKMMEKIKMGELKEQEIDAYMAEHIAPLFENFHKWLLENKLKALPKSKLGQAISYTLNQWPKYIVMLKDHRIVYSNNHAERAIRPFVVGRKNWIFSGSPRGAKSSAVIYSIVETAKANNLVPQKYLEYIFKTAPNIDYNNTDEIDQLLPWNDQVKKYCQGPLSPQS